MPTQYIKGYEGLYTIDNDGVIFSKISNKIMKQSNSGDGYKMIGLYKNKKVKYFRVHRLIAEAFIPNTEDKPYINHKNGIRDDNRIENLEWCTNSENQLHSFRELGRMPTKMRKIGMYNKCQKLLNTFQSATEASKKLGFTRTGINHCALGQTNSCSGFIWKYI